MKNKLITPLILLSAVSMLGAQNVFIDFGGGGASETSIPGWNNVTGVGSMPSAAQLVDFNTLENSGISYQITTSFAATNGQGGDLEWGDFPFNATRDSFYSQGSATPTIVFSGFDPNTAYDFTFVSARASSADNRSTEFTLIGATTTSTAVNASIPNSGTISESNLGFIGSVFADENGIITLIVSAGADNNNGSLFTYLNAMNIVAVPEPGTYALIFSAIALGIVVLRRKRHQ